MLRRSMFTTVAVLAGSALVAQGAAKDDVSAAAKKLSDAKSYSWTQKTEFQGGQGGGGGGGRFGGGPTEGKTDGEVIYITMTRGDGNTSEAVIKGEKGAVKTQDGWQSFEELRNAARDNQGGGQGGGRGRFGAMMFRNVRPPAEQAQELANGVKELSKSGDAYAGELTEDAAKQMLMFRGGRRGGRGGQGGQGGQGGDGNGPPAPTNAKGTVKFWMNDGNLSKYEVNVKGTMSFQGQEREIDRTTTVEIKDVGSTKVDVPAEAKAKLS